MSANKILLVMFMRYMYSTVGGVFDNPPRSDKVGALLTNLL